MKITSWEDFVNSHQTLDQSTSTIVHAWLEQAPSQARTQHWSPNSPVRDTIYYLPSSSCSYNCWTMSAGMATTTSSSMCTSMLLRKTCGMPSWPNQLACWTNRCYRSSSTQAGSLFLGPPFSLFSFFVSMSPYCLIRVFLIQLRVTNFHIMDSEPIDFTSLFFPCHQFCFSYSRFTLSFTFMVFLEVHL